MSLLFSQAGPFTLQAWVRTPNRLQPEFTGVIASGGSGQSATTFQLELDGFGNYRLNAGNGDVSILIGPATDFFQHVAVTFDGATIAAYLNGQRVESEPWFGPPDLGFTTLAVGIDRDAQFPFEGVVDEVQLFNRALSDAEVLQAFEAGASGLQKNRPPVAVAVVTPNPAEAAAPGGAFVLLDATASSDPDGDALTYAWMEGPTTIGVGATFLALLPIGSHIVTLTVDDGHGHVASVNVDVVVHDTTAPAVLIASPSPDALIAASSTDVVAQVADAVGVSGVAVNGVPAAFVGGTAQAGTWRATVPVILPVVAGGALAFNVTAIDTFGNVSAATRFVDNDGIPSLAPAALDRGRTDGADQGAVFSNDFNNGVTSGTLVRNGWATKLSNAPTPNGVRVQAIAAGTGAARVLACIGAAKEVRLDVVGETADITCDPFAGTITVKAVSAVAKIEVWKQTSPTTWTVAQLPRGATYSTGSPATAGAENTSSITVHVVRLDAAGASRIVGSFELAPGASVDVTTAPALATGIDEMHFRVLRGVIPVTVGGRTRTLRTGELTTMPIDRGIKPLDR